MKAVAVLFSLLMLTPSAARAAEEPRPETVTLDGETFILVPDEVPRTKGFDIPVVPREENAAYDYLQIMQTFPKLEYGSDLYRLRDVVVKGRWTEESQPLAKYLQENAKALPLLQKGCAKSLCHFPFLVNEDDSPDDVSPMGLLLPHLSYMREFALFLATKGKAQELDGHVSEALETYLLPLRIGNHTSQDPIPINGLVGIACNAIGMRAIEQSLVRYDHDEETLARVQERVRLLSKERPEFRHSLRSERLFAQEVTAWVTRDPTWLWEVSKQTGRKPGFYEIYKATMFCTPKGRAEAERKLREFWKFMDEASTLPLCEFMQREKEFDILVSPSWSVVRLYGPALWRARVQYGRNELSWIVLDIEFALARHKAEHGAYPEKLDDVKDLMLTDGTDPFSGEPLRYRLEKDGAFTIWSVGENLTDDGGKVEPDYRWIRDDYVWNSRLLAGGPAE